MAKEGDGGVQHFTATMLASRSIIVMIIVISRTLMIVIMFMCVVFLTPW